VKFNPGYALRLLIVDEDAAVRASLRRLLASEFPTFAFAEAGDGTTAMAQILEAPPALVLLDLKLQGKSGLVVLKESKAANPSLPVVIVTVGDVNDGQEGVLRRFGADGYVEKSEISERLVGLVRTILETRES
jgi:two-component system OmpR family response regulator